MGFFNDLFRGGSGQELHKYRTQTGGQQKLTKGLLQQANRKQGTFKPSFLPTMQTNPNRGQSQALQTISQIGARQGQPTNNPLRGAAAQQRGAASQGAGGGQAKPSGPKDIPDIINKGQSQIISKILGILSGSTQAGQAAPRR